MCIYFEVVSWDRDKAEANAVKHGVNFADAATVLVDAMAVTVRDDAVDEQERWVTLGMDALGRVLVVVYAWEDDEPRLATRREIHAYEGKR